MVDSTDIDYSTKVFIGGRTTNTNLVHSAAPTNECFREGNSNSKTFTDFTWVAFVAMYTRTSMTWAKYFYSDNDADQD